MKKIGMIYKDAGIYENGNRASKDKRSTDEMKMTVLEQLYRFGILEVEFGDSKTIKQKLKNGELDYIALSLDDSMASKKHKSGKDVEQEKNRDFIFNENLYLVTQIDYCGRPFGVYSLREKGKISKAAVTLIASACDMIRNILFGTSVSQFLVFLALIFTFLLIFRIGFWGKLEFWVELLAAIIGLFSSKYISDLIKYYPLTGYWRYYTTKTSLETVNPEYKKRTKDKYARVMRVYRCNGSLKMCAYVQSLPNRPHCHSKMCEVIYTSPSHKEGILAYWFGSRNAITSNTKKSVNGMAMLEWHIEKRHLRVTEMNGDFCGITTRRMGTFDCERISKKEFYRYINGK